MTKREAWKRVSEAFDTPKHAATNFGLCYAMNHFTGRHSDVTFRALKRWASDSRWHSAFMLLPCSPKYRPIRATIAALFAAMTDEERIEVLGI